MAEEIKLTQDEAPESRNFIHAFIEEDIGPGGQFEGMTVHTRFPPEPNGYLHIGHCKALTIDFGTAEKFGGLCNLRMDDTNPTKEDEEFVDAIQQDIHWLGFDWGDRFFYGSDYFDEDYRQAVGLIKKGLAYVCELTPEQFKEYRGDTTTPARSPWRDRPIEESLDLFERMKNGEFPEGKYTLRAKIDLASGNFNMRDPVLYRINYLPHHRQGNKWCIYPMYDFTHCLSDSLEGITHSICTLEFEDQRAFYNWALERIIPLLRTPQYEEALKVIRAMADGEDNRAMAFVKAAFESRAKLGGSLPEEAVARLMQAWENGLPETIKDETVTQFFATLLCFPENFTPLMQAALDVVRPNFFLLSHQYEFNRLNLTYVVVSKRKLIQLVQEKYVDGWDDPRMPTIVGLRRRGFTPKSLQNFAERCGVSKVSGGWIDYSVLEQCLREDLEERAERRVAVLRPLKLIIDNYPEGQTEELEANNHPQKPEMGTRRISFSRELWIEEGDFAEVPPKGFRRLTVPADGTPAKPVRLRYGYVIVPTSFEKDESGRVTAVHAEYLPETRSGSEGSMSVKTKATIHWLDAKTAVPAEIRVYDRLFNVPHPDEGEGSFLDRLTPDSKTVLSSYVEPAAAAAARDDKFQFERNGYFVADREDHTAEKPVFNLAVGLKDSWGK